MGIIMHVITKHADIKLKHFCYPTLNNEKSIYILEFN